LPEDTTVEDAMEHLVMLGRVEQRLQQARRGETIPHAEVRRRMEAKMASRTHRGVR
jgi:hypothetical protein